MKVQYALLLQQLTHDYATFHHPDDVDVPRYSLAVREWIQLDRPVHITVTVENR